jgi:hypothetical protein
MTLTYAHLIGANLVALAIVVAVLLTAPNLAVGTGRLRAMVRIMCVTIASAGYVLSLTMLVWGVTTHSEGLMYFSFW